MVEKYIGLKTVMAEPEERDGIKGYKVVYEDGYESWCPASSFESAYHPTSGAPFGVALEHVKRGGGMRLSKWASDIVIRAQIPDEYSKMTAPYLYVESRNGRVPWVVTQIELITNGWECVE